MMDKKLVERLTKPDVSESWGLIYWEVITHIDGVDEATHHYFIEEKPAREFMLSQMKAGHISWKYRRTTYHIRLLDGIKFEDE